MSSHDVSLHGDLEDVWRHDHVDSSRSRQVELDFVLASMLQEIENRRADKLQEMVAEALREMEQERKMEEKKDESG